MFVLKNLFLGRINQGYQAQFILSLSITKYYNKAEVNFDASGKAIVKSGTLIVEASAMKKGSTAKGMLDSQILNTPNTKNRRSTSKSQ